jgi:hypothetical protein
VLPIQNAAGVMEHAGMGMPMDPQTQHLRCNAKVRQICTHGHTEQLTLTLAIGIILIVPVASLMSMDIMDMAVVGVGVAVGSALLTEPWDQPRFNVKLHLRQLWGQIIFGPIALNAHPERGGL